MIEMLRELDEDTWETLAKCFQFRLLHHWTEDEDMLWARQLVTMVKKRNGKTMLPTMYRLFLKILQQLAAHSMVTSLVVRLTRWVFILRRMVEQATEWQVPIFVMDCDVAAAFDHVSHHVIIEVVEALTVPSVSVAAWIREYREVRNIRQAGRHHDTRNSSHTIGGTRRPVRL